MDMRIPALYFKFMFKPNLLKPTMLVRGLAVYGRYNIIFRI